ncbi:DMT family transporter [Methylotenera sp.]|uniref:DMT family transporter n=1 Tax=Methylotenera sp. TaxID=2051956 RepID=UPI002488734B|nr:DMT family transporter [Methylotenera sp.]MDI1298143.1 DMT family transporter [Methylotenera sp.]
MNNINTYMMATMAAVFWGANFNLARPVVAEMGPYIAGASRYILAAIIMVLITQIKRESTPLRYWRKYLALGIVGVFGFNLFFFLGMQTTSAINGALIMALNPLLTAILGYLILQERLSTRQIIAFPIGIIGVAIVVLGAGAHLKISIGDTYILVANLSWALYNVLVRKIMPKDVSGVANTAGIMTVGAIALSFVALSQGDRLIVTTLSTAIALMIMTIGGSILAYLFWNASITKLGPSKAAIFMNLVPVTSMIIAAIESHPPNHAQILGAILVISAITFSSISNSK